MSGIISRDGVQTKCSTQTGDSNQYKECLQTIQCERIVVKKQGIETKRNNKHRTPGLKIISPPGHELSSDQSLSAEAGCASFLESLSQLVSVYPNTVAAAFSLSVKWLQCLMEDQGFSSLPDKLSQVTGVYPITRKAACSLSQANEDVVSSVSTN